MKRKTTLKLATALIASSLIAMPIASAYAQPDGPKGQRMSEHGDFKDCQFGGKHHGPGKHGKHGQWGMRDHDRARSTPLSVDEARTLIDSMLIRSNAENIKISDVTASEDGEKINVVVANKAGDVVEVVKFDAKNGRLERGDRWSLRKLMPRPDKKARLERAFDDAQMKTLAQAMVIRFGQGDLKLGEISQTKRGTYLATVTNSKGDIVREMELSRVTGRPIS